MYGVEIRENTEFGNEPEVIVIIGEGRKKRAEHFYLDDV